MRLKLPAILISLIILTTAACLSAQSFLDDSLEVIYHDIINDSTSSPYKVIGLDAIVDIMNDDIHYPFFFDFGDQNTVGFGMYDMGDTISEQYIHDIDSLYKIPLQSTNVAPLEDTICFLLKNEVLIYKAINIAIKYNDITMTKLHVVSYDYDETALIQYYLENVDSLNPSEFEYYVEKHYASNVTTPISKTFLDIKKSYFEVNNKLLSFSSPDLVLNNKTVKL